MYLHKIYLNKFEKIIENNWYLFSLSQGTMSRVGYDCDKDSEIFHILRKYDVSYALFSR